MKLISNEFELSFSFRCNFGVRNLADNIHTYTVQCSLPINLFNEKIFLIIWFWLYFATLFTLFGFIYWMISIFYPKFYKNNLIRYLSSMKRINIHHFPQNPFQEQMHHRSFHHHHHHSLHSHHRRYAFAHGHHSSMHVAAAHHHHQQLLSSFASRTMQSNFDTTRLSHVKEQLEVPTAIENIETNVTSTSEELSTAPATPQRTTDMQSNSVTLANEESRAMTQFLKDYLGRDGTLVLYLLKINTNEVITGEIVTALFELFKTNYRTNTTE